MNLLEHFTDKKIYVFTDSDLDGVSSHIVAKYYIEPLCEQFLFTISNDRAMKDFSFEFSDNSEIIIFVDIAPTIDVYKSLIESGKEVFIFDHHITSYTDLMSTVESNYYFTQEKCGCKIFLDELVADRRPEKAMFQFIQLSDTYDRWQKSSILWKDAEKLQNIMYEYVNWFDKNLTDNEKFQVFIDRQLEKIEKGKLFYFTQYEDGLAKKALEKKKKNLEVARKTLKIRVDNSGNNYGYFECNSKLSIVGNIILDEYEHLNYIIGHSTYSEVYNKIPNGKVSLRSKNNFDVSSIASIHGGGGHPNASGVDLPLELFNKVKEGSSHLI